MGERSWPGLFARLIRHEDLDPADTDWVMDRVLAGEASPAQLGGFLVGLRSKGETPGEIAGLAAAMLRHGKRVDVDVPAVDVVGTGGDGAHTVNISTMAALVVAASGMAVVKHGNRAASSACGSADVLEALGVAIDLPPAAVGECVRRLGIGFCFAPVFHPSMRHTGVPRREIGVPTAMNLLGPLTNPGQPNAGLIGCADARIAPVIAQVFAERTASVLVVRGDDGLDELTTTTTSTVWAVADGEVRTVSVDPAALGISPALPADLRGGAPEENAAAFHALVAGKAGPVREAVLLNAAGALVAAAGPRGDLAEAFRPALARVAEAIDSGAARALLSRWVELSAQLRPAS